MFSVVKHMNTGSSWDMLVISTNLDNKRPIPTPPRVDAVNYETLLPDMSPMLFLLANYTLILARDAADRRKHIFLPMLANDASNKKCEGNLRVRISI